MTYHLAVAVLIGVVLPLTRLFERRSIRNCAEILTLGAAVALFAFVVVPDYMWSAFRGGMACVWLRSGFVVSAGIAMTASLLAAALWVLKLLGYASLKKSLRAAGWIAAVGAIMFVVMSGPSMGPCGYFDP